MTSTIYSSGQHVSVSNNTRKMFSSVRKYATRLAFASFAFLGAENAVFAQDAKPPAALTAEAPKPVETVKPAELSTKLDSMKKWMLTFKSKKTGVEYTATTVPDDIKSLDSDSAAKLDAIVRAKIESALPAEMSMKKKRAAVKSIIIKNKRAYSDQIADMKSALECRSRLQDAIKANPASSSLTDWTFRFSYPARGRSKRQYEFTISMDAIETQATSPPKALNTWFMPSVTAQLEPDYAGKKLKKAVTSVMSGKGTARALRGGVANALYCKANRDQVLAMFGITPQPITTVEIPKETEPVVSETTKPTVTEAKAEGLARANNGEFDNAAKSLISEPAPDQMPEPSILHNSKRVGLNVDNALFDSRMDFAAGYSYNVFTAKNGTSKLTIPGSDTHNFWLRFRMQKHVMLGLGAEHAYRFATSGAELDLLDRICRSDCSFSQLNMWAGKLSALFQFNSNGVYFMAEPGAQIGFSRELVLLNVFTPSVESTGKEGMDFAAFARAGLFVPGKFVGMIRGSSDIYSPSGIQLGYTPIRSVELELSASTAALLLQSPGNPIETGNYGRNYSLNGTATYSPLSWIGAVVGARSGNTSVYGDARNYLDAVLGARFALGPVFAGVSYLGNFDKNNSVALSFATAGENSGTYLHGMGAISSGNNILPKEAGKSNLGNAEVNMSSLEEGSK